MLQDWFSNFLTYLFFCNKKIQKQTLMFDVNELKCHLKKFREHFLIRDRSSDRHSFACKQFIWRSEFTGALSIHQKKCVCFVIFTRLYMLKFIINSYLQIFTFEISQTFRSLYLFSYKEKTDLQINFAALLFAFMTNDKFKQISYLCCV